MSELALDLGDGRMLATEEIARPIRRRIKDAQAARKPLEAVWLSNLAYAAGKFFLKWDRDQRQLVFPPDPPEDRLSTKLSPVNTSTPTWLLESKPCGAEMPISYRIVPADSPEDRVRSKPPSGCDV